MPASADAVRLPLDQLVPSALNPRRTVNAAADLELLESIKAHGILTPLLVRCIERDEQDTYEIVAGHRRYTAAIELGLEAVPVTVRELSDDQAREAAIIENLHREDLAPLDEAESYQALLSIPGASPASIAAAVGKSPAHIGRRLKLLTLIDDAKHALRDGRMDVARAELLTKLSPELQAKALEEAVWLPMFRVREGDQETGTLATLEPLSELRWWVERRTRLDVADLIADDETRALFPEASEAVREIEWGVDAPPLLEVALDRFGQSPAQATIPADVLRLNRDYREVTGKKCKFAQRAFVVFGDRKGEVLLVCCEKKGPTTCNVHWPLKVKADPSAQAAKRPPWEVQEAERKRVQAIWERVRPDVEKVIIAASAKVRTTPKLLQEILDRTTNIAQSAAVIKAIGKLTPETFGRVYVIADAFDDLYSVDGAERALKAVNGFFDVKKAMKAAEAAMASERTVPKTEAKKATGKPTKKTRRVA